MSENEENLVEDSSDGMSMNYATMNLPHEDDENDEGIAEYLDLDLENAIVEDYDDQEGCSKIIDPTSIRVQTSVLKKNLPAATKNNDYNSRSLRAESSADAPATSPRRRRSSTENTKNSSIQRKKRKASINFETDQVRASVNEINARLANSGNFFNNHAPNDGNLSRNTKLDSYGVSKNEGSKIKPDLDSVDLFFLSMAQTAMTLPPTLQAKIKMDICKVIATAEMKYSNNVTSTQLHKYL